VWLRNSHVLLAALIHRIRTLSRPTSQHNPHQPPAPAFESCPSRAFNSAKWKSRRRLGLALRPIPEQCSESSPMTHDGERLGSPAVASSMLLRQPHQHRKGQTISLALPPAHQGTADGTPATLGPRLRPKVARLHPHPLPRRGQQIVAPKRKTKMYILQSWHSALCGIWMGAGCRAVWRRRPVPSIHQESWAGSEMEATLVSTFARR
jgi:hypothetical protein